MSSVISVAVHFKREAGSYFTCKENTRHAPGLQSLARIAVETSISYTPAARSNGIKRTIWLFIVEVYPVRYSKQGILQFPKHRQLCVNNSAILTVKAQD